MLSTALTVLAVAVLLILLVLVIVLCLPVHLDVRFNTKADPPAQVQVGLLGGVLALPIAPGKAESKAATPKAKTKKSKKRKRDGAGVNVLPMVRHLPRLLSRLISIVKFERLSAIFGFGFDSPADTGMVYGMLSPFERTIGNRPKCQIALHPDFDRANFESEGHVAARFTPAAIFPPLIGFGWNAVLKPRLARGRS